MKNLNSLGLCHWGFLWGQNSLESCRIFTLFIAHTSGLKAL